MNFPDLYPILSIIIFIKFKTGPKRNIDRKEKKLKNKTFLLKFTYK